MARKSERSALVLTPEVRSTLKELAASRSAQTREVARAKVMLGYADGVSITEPQRRLGFSHPMIYRCVDKALATGVQAGLKDKYHRPHEPEISDEAKAWVVSVACTKPKDQSSAPLQTPHRAVSINSPHEYRQARVRGSGTSAKDANKLSLRVSWGIGCADLSF